MKKHVIIFCAVFALEFAVGLLIYGKTSTLVFENDRYIFMSSNFVGVVLKSKDKTIRAEYEEKARLNNFYPIFCGNFEVLLPNGKKVSFRRDYDIYDPDNETTTGGKYVNIIHSDGKIIAYPIEYLHSKVYMMTTQEREEFFLQMPETTFENGKIGEKEKEELLLLDTITEKKNSIIEFKDFIKYIVITTICFVLALTSIIFSKILNSRDKSGGWLIKCGYVFSIAPIILLIIIIV